ncbi:MAG: tRNA (adenosine(37)-N6)-threonylcarbamoyltransferase complex transferase subunit TsaD, partial [Verrucomicrobiota bacterium]
MILAVESSCDESALAAFDPARGIVRETVSSQAASHEKYGGVVPDLASRMHLSALPLLLEVFRDELPAVT